MSPLEIKYSEETEIFGIFFCTCWKKDLRIWVRFDEDMMRTSVPGTYFFFIFFIWVYSPKGLCPILDSVYLYATSTGPMPLSSPELPVASCEAHHGCPFPYRTQLGVGPTVYGPTLIGSDLMVTLPGALYLLCLIVSSSVFPST